MILNVKFLLAMLLFSFVNPRQINAKDSDYVISEVNNNT